jgi:glutaredoxin
MKGLLYGPSGRRARGDGPATASERLLSVNTSDNSEPVQPPRVRLLSKPGCHLCDAARAVIDAVCLELGERYEEVDITSDSELAGRYAEQIPVTFVDGRQHDFWRVEPDRLRRALRGA